MDERAFRYVECTIPNGMTAHEYLRHTRGPAQQRGSARLAVASRVMLRLTRVGSAAQHQSRSRPQRDPARAAGR
jgi:hypothetical protein